MLDPQGVALVGKGAQAHIETALRAVRDEHLARIADNAARGAQMLGDSHAQRGFAGGIAVIELARRQCAPRAVQHAPPLRQGKFVERRHARRKRAQRVGGKYHRRVHILPRHAAQMPGAARQTILDIAGRRRSIRPTGAASDDGATPIRQDKPFAGQLFVGVQHGIARHAQFCGQHARGGQPRAGSELAAADRRAQAFMQQALARPAPLAVRLLESVQQQSKIHVSPCCGSIFFLCSGSFLRARCRL